MIPNGLSNLFTIDNDTRQKTFELGQSGGSSENRLESGEKDQQWKVGEIDFEARMRMLDNSVSLNHFMNVWSFFVIDIAFLF